VVVALLGAGLYAGYRWVARTARQMLDEAEQTRADEARRGKSVVTKDLGALELDPASGVYKPKQRS
jgi:hypothetical protein